MKILSGIATVSTAGTPVQLSNTPRRCRWMKLKAHGSNSSAVYVEDADSPGGYPLEKGEELELNFWFAGGTVAMNSFYVDAAVNAEYLYWFAILDG